MTQAVALAFVEDVGGLWSWTKAGLLSAGFDALRHKCRRDQSLELGKRVIPREIGWRPRERPQADPPRVLPGAR